jgi:peptidoglycan-N-acetylglucosamine deacetylase
MSSPLPEKTGTPGTSQKSSGTHPGRAVLYRKAKVTGAYISITFDDGPHAALTPRLLNILGDHGVHATFFLEGKKVKTFPKIVERICNDGHAIGNHTFTHPDLTSLPDEVVLEEITRTQGAIADAARFTPWLFRPPYGDLTERQRELVERKLALKAIGWSVDPEDWNDPGPAVVTDRILHGWAKSPGAFHGAIILCHDTHAGTVEAMPKTLADLKGQGYRFLTIDELRAVERGVGDWPMPPREESTV